MAAIHPMQTGGGNNFKQNKKVVKKKVNPLKAQRVIDYLDAKSLSRYINDQGKILPKRITGVTAFQQRKVAKAIKYARHLALIPFVAHDVN
jgi:small subunit ribosomal protein S18